jgi:hypothetical protein
MLPIARQRQRVKVAAEVQKLLIHLKVNKTAVKGA